MNDTILDKFVQILCGTLDNKAQVDQEVAANNQVHPYAVHVTAVCNHKIINRPEDHEGLYILEESYYTYPGKELDIKPLLFYVRADGNKVLLNSVQIPPHLNKADVINANQDLIFDWNDLKLRPFGTAEYVYHEEGHFTVDHEADMGDGLTFRLIETLSTEGLNVMELVHKDGVKLTPYDTPILYRRVS